MTDIDIEAIRKRAEAATPGPWRKIIDDTGGEFTPWPSVDAPADLDTSVIHRAGFKQEYWEANSLRQCTADADFIAHAREDIPALLSALEAEKRRADGAEARYNSGDELRNDAMLALSRCEDENDTLRARVAELERSFLRQFANHDNWVSGETEKQAQAFAERGLLQFEQGNGHCGESATRWLYTLTPSGRAATTGGKE